MKLKRFIPSIPLPVNTSLLPEFASIALTHDLSWQFKQKILNFSCIAGEYHCLCSHIQYVSEILVLLYGDFGMNSHSVSSNEAMAMEARR
jgi:hypothetical protein